VTTEHKASKLQDIAFDLEADADELPGLEFDRNGKLLTDKTPTGPTDGSKKKSDPQR
jgi:hypothetical protein